MSSQATSPKYRILMADDEPNITMLMAAILVHAGFQVVQALGGAEAVTLARQEKPDLILLDVMMPDLDGRDVCKLLKMDQALRDVPIILFSSADEADVHWRRAKADGFLQKPFSVRTLPDLVRGYLSGAVQ